MCNDTKGNCIAEILNVILMLQRNACGDECLDTCDRGFLACGATTLNCNTRPITLYTCGCCNTPFAMPISRDPAETTTSTIFRVEKLDGNCATFRVLVLNDDGTYTSTNSFFTMNLDCYCVIRCLNDTFVEGV